MTRKDFEVIACAIRDATIKAGDHSTGDHMRHMIIDELCKQFEALNPRFDATRFAHACRQRKFI